MYAKQLIGRVAGAIALSSFSVAAHATIINGSFGFTATDFIGGGTPPIATAVGTVTYSFDNSSSFADLATGFSVTGLNVPGSLGPAMTYFQAGDFLIFGDVLGTANYIYEGTNDWGLGVTHASTNPTFADFNYSVAASVPQTVYTTFTGSIAPLITPIPEPSTMLLALVAIAIAALNPRAFGFRSPRVTSLHDA